MNRTKAIVSSKFLGHIFTFTTIFIWSTAFVSNKALLNYLSPIQNMFFRFAIAYVLLLAIYPKEFFPKSIKDELHFAFIGFLGIFLYFILENFSLKYTQATNVGLYMGAIPLFTAIFAHFFTKDESLKRDIVIGFLVALSGMILILFDGSGFTLRVKGDLLAVVGAMVFALYSVFLKLIPKNYHYIAVTRKSFFWGLFYILLYIFYFDINFNIKALGEMSVFLNILYLGILSSGLAFILWNRGIEKIGSISAANYIYLVPLITAITGILILGETVSIKMVIGGVLILIGLYIAQKR